jgi:hypothetical protein
MKVTQHPNMITTNVDSAGEAAPFLHFVNPIIFAMLRLKHTPMTRR